MTVVEFPGNPWPPVAQRIPAQIYLLPAIRIERHDDDANRVFVGDLIAHGLITTFIGFDISADGDYAVEVEYERQPDGTVIVKKSTILSSGS